MVWAGTDVPWAGDRVVGLGGDAECIPDSEGGTNAGVGEGGHVGLVDGAAVIAGGAAQHDEEDSLGCC